MKSPMIAGVLTAALLTLGPDGSNAGEQKGVVTKRSAHTVQATLDKLEKIVTDKGFTVFARVDHAAGAAKVGQALRPTQTLIFGNPKVGTKIMNANQAASLDLPIKVAAWEDADGTVWVSYNDPAWLVGRHGIGNLQPVVDKMTGALGKLTDGATK